MHKTIRGHRPQILIAHPSAELYGSDRVLLETLEGLRAAGADVLLSLPSDGPLIREAELRGADVEICPTPVLRRSLLTPLGLFRLVGQMLVSTVKGISLIRRVRPDAIYINTITIPLWAVLGRLARLPSIIHIHEAEGNAPALIRRAINCPLFLGTALITNSEFSKKVLASSFPSLAARTKIVANGVPGPEFAAPARKYLEGPLRIAYVGRLSQRKGVDLVLDAAGLLLARGIEAEVTLIGSVYPGNEPYEKALKERAGRPDLKGRVVFLGFQHSVWGPLADADVVVVPSRAEESFGNTAVEAALAQRPTVVSGGSGLLEAIEGFYSSVQVTPDDAAAIADALERIVDHWPTYRDAAVVDQTKASDRNGIVAYRNAVSSAVLALVSRLPYA